MSKNKIETFFIGIGEYVFRHSKRYTDDESVFSLTGLVGWLVVFLSILSLAAYNIKSFPLEVYISFWPQIFIVSSGLMLLFLSLLARLVIRDGLSFSRNGLRKLDVLKFIGCVMIFGFLWFESFFNPVQSISMGQSSGPSVRVATFNKLVNNQSAQGVEALAALNPEIVVIQELESDLVAAYQNILGLEYLSEVECNCSAGLSDVYIMSKFPIVATRLTGGDSGWNLINAKIVHSEVGIISVYAIHLPPPFSNRHYHQRNALFDSLAREISVDANPVIAMGDFNTTIYSPVFREFSGKVSSKVSLALENNWPKCSRYENRLPIDALCVRIDHIFLPTTASVTDTAIIRNVKSDHLPFMVEVTF